MRFSTARRFRSLPLMRRQKSSRLLNSPSSLRFATTSFMKPLPMFFIATRPKRIFSPSTVKSASERFRSGGSRAMPMLRHSEMYSAT